MQRKVVVNTNCYHGYGIHEALNGIHKAGFRYVELTATRGWTEHVFPEQRFREICEVKELCQTLGLEPFALSGHTNLMDERRFQYFQYNVELARFFGAGYIVSSLGEAHLHDEAALQQTVLIKHLSSLIPKLEAYEMTLVLEIHGPEYGSGGRLLPLVRALDSPRVKINYDTANAIYYGHCDPVADLATCIDEVAYLHIKDKDGEMEEWNFPALGTGTVDFPAIIELLDQARNPAPLSIEIEFTPAGAGSIEAVHQAVWQSAAYLRRLGMEL